MIPAYPAAPGPGRLQALGENQRMLQVLLVTFPFFALVLAGYVAARRRMLPLEAIPGLNGFVLFFALPCLLFRFGSSIPIAKLLDASAFLTYLACALVLVGFVVAVSLNRRIGWNDAAFGALVAAFPNTGFMGVPLLVALLGPAAAGPAILTILVDILITTSLCTALSRLDGADEHGVARAARNALRGVMVNPMPWAIVLGALASAVELQLPAPVLQTLGLLADAASPVAFTNPNSPMVTPPSSGSGTIDTAVSQACSSSPENQRDSPRELLDRFADSTTAVMPLPEQVTDRWTRDRR